MMDRPCDRHLTGYRSTSARERIRKSREALELLVEMMKRTEVQIGQGVVDKQVLCAKAETYRLLTKNVQITLEKVASGRFRQI